MSFLNRRMWYGHAAAFALAFFALTTGTCRRIKTAACRNRRIRWGLGVALVVVIVALAVLIRMKNEATAETNAFEIALVYWRKPEAPAPYDAYVYGLKAAVSEINRAGGIGGHRLRLRPMDDKGSPAESIRIASEIAKSDKIVAVVGYGNTVRAVAAVPTLSAAGVPVLSSTASSAVMAVDQNGVFFSTNAGVKGELRYLKEFCASLSCNRAVFIGEKDDPLSEEYSDKLKALLPGTDIIWLASTESVSEKDALRETLRGACKEGDIIVISLRTASAAAVASLVRQAGFGQPIILTKGGMRSGEFFNGLGTALERVYELSPILPGVGNQSISDFREKHHSFFTKPDHLASLAYATYAYDMGWMLKKAFDQAAVPAATRPGLDALGQTRNIIRTGLTSFTDQVPFDGVSDSFSFGSDRMGGVISTLYIIEACKGTIEPYSYQFHRGMDGRLARAPVVKANLGLRKISPLNVEASEYQVEFTLALISPEEVTFEDIEFDNLNVALGTSSSPITAKPLVGQKTAGRFFIHNYLVQGSFMWDNTIRDFPFDHQKFGIVMKPRNALTRNFIVYFPERSSDSLATLDITKWKVTGSSSGLNKGSYELADNEGKPTRSYYYQAAYVLSAARKPLGPFIKFLLPLSIIVFMGLFLIFAPDEFASDILATSYGMVLAVIALYFSYVSVVDIDYPTLVDILFFGALGILFINNLLFITLHKARERAPGGGVLASRVHIAYKWLFSSVTIFAVISVCVVLTWRVIQASK